MSDVDFQQRYLNIKNTALVTIEFRDRPDSSYDFVVVLEPYMEELDFSNALQMLRSKSVNLLSLFRGGLSYKLSADHPYLERRHFVYLLQQFVEEDNSERKKLFITARGKSLALGLYYQIHSLFLPRIRECTSQNMQVIRLSDSSLRSRFQKRTTSALVTVEFNDPSYNFPVILEPGFNMANFLHGLQHLNSMNMRRVHLFKETIIHTLPGSDWTLLPRKNFASLLQEHVDESGQPNGRLFITARGSKLSTKATEHIHRLTHLGAHSLILWWLLPRYEAFIASLVLALWLWRPQIVRLIFA